VGGLSADSANPGHARDGGGTYRHLDAASGGATDGDVEEDLSGTHATMYVSACSERREKHQFEAPPRGLISLSMIAVARLVIDPLRHDA